MRYRLFLLFKILLIALVAFTACDCGERGYGGYEVGEAPEPYEQAPIQTPAPTPTPIPGATETPAPVETPTPIEAPEQTPTPALVPGERLPPSENRYVFESGVLNTKFSVIQPLRFGFWGHNSVRRDETLLSAYWRDTLDSGDMSFEIWQGVTHPSQWIRVFENEIRRGERQGWILQWEQPDEPTEVFVNGSGLTVVKYVHEYVRYEWFDDSPRDVTTVLFMFRRDGRDYRDFHGAQIFYLVILNAESSRFDEFYTRARAIVESFMFLEDTAEIDLEPSETARSLGITAYNYPRIDGSTSVISLASELIKTMFMPYGTDPWRMWRGYDRIWNLSRTIPAYELLIGNYVDLIFVPEPSAYVLELADAAGVELEFTPIAMEALVFITTINNPADKVTIEQILQIYTEMSITNWADLGGYDGPIHPYNRNPHSGSQTLMENLVLQGREIHPGLSQFEVDGMASMIDHVERFHPDGWWYGLEHEPNTFALGYTVSAFFNHQDTILKALAIDGVFPSREAILSGEYPLTTNYFAVIRTDSPDDSPERRIANWLATPEGQAVVESAGLIGLSP